MGTDCTRILANLFVSFYEYSYIKNNINGIVSLGKCNNISEIMVHMLRFGRGGTGGTPGWACLAFTGKFGNLKMAIAISIMCQLQ